MLENVEELRSEILSEIVDLEKALAVRMRNIIAGTGMLSDAGPLDLASIQVISQVIHGSLTNLSIGSQTKLAGTGMLSTQGC